MFNVGDRVVSCEYGEGTVLSFSAMSGRPLVEFDTFHVFLHDGYANNVHKIRGKGGHCWYTRDIKHLGPTLTPKEKVLAKIKYLENKYATRMAAKTVF